MRELANDITRTLSFKKDFRHNTTKPSGESATEGEDSGEKVHKIRDVSFLHILHSISHPIFQHLRSSLYSRPEPRKCESPEPDIYPVCSTCVRHLHT